MLENNLKELGTMLVKAGNTIERQKEEIERLRRENDVLKNRQFSMREFLLTFHGEFNLIIYDVKTKEKTYYKSGTQLDNIPYINSINDRGILLVSIVSNSYGEPLLYISLDD